MDRAAARSHGTGFYTRRMGVLLVIGLVHGLAIWWGDILAAYAICGLCLLLFRKRTQRTIMIWAQIVYWFLPVLFLGFYVATRFGLEPPSVDGASRMQEVIALYANGTVREVFAVRAHEWAEANGFVLVLTRVFGIILLGVYIWRQGYLQRPGRARGVVEARAVARARRRDRRQSRLRRVRVDVPPEPPAAVGGDGR